MGLSFQFAVVLTPLINTLAIDGKFFSSSVDAGFIRALLLHHGDLELDRVAWPNMVGGPMQEIKIPVQELWLKM